MSLTEELRKRRSKLEADLLRTINEFEQETGVVVSCIGTDMWYTVGKPDSTGSVNVEVRL